MQKEITRSLVTGGAGFIGSHLVDSLLEMGHQVICIDNESSECHDSFYWNDKAKNYKYDICNYDQIKDLFKDIDYVFHLASDARIQPAIINPKKSIENNTIGVSNVLNLSRINNIKKVIYSSTSSSYGKNNLPPNKEDQQPDPLTPYSAAKVFGEHLCKVYFDLYGLKTISLRYFNVYGDRQPLKGQYAPVIGLFLKQSQEGNPLTIVGDGEQRRDFTHVSDVVDANILAATKDLSSEDFGQLYNVGNGKNYSVNEIAKMISDKIVHIPPRLGESRQTLADSSKIKKTMGWDPKISLSSWVESQIKS